MANTFKNIIDRLIWVQVPPAPNPHVAAAALACDMRNDRSRNPFVYQLVNNTILNRYNMITKSWNFIQSPALAGTFGAGAAMAFVPSFSLVGTIAAGATTTSVVLTTALPATIGLNMLANRGGSGEMGFKLRIIDTTAGRTVERLIIGNTGGTTPTLTVNAAFGFTPAAGSRYEILSGRVFMLGSGAVAANIWRSFETASNFLSTGLSTTNLPATITTDSSIMVLDEQYTPYTNIPGTGMIKGAYNYDTNNVNLLSLTATAAALGTITGQSSLGDAIVAANEFRNFQIRIVEDTTTPAAVGQRRIIGSHTAGPSPVYTLGTNWSTTPSATAKYVIELPNLLLLRTTANTTVYVYNYTDATINNGTNNITAGSWSTTYFAAAPAAGAAGGLWAPSHGIVPDPARNARHSFCYFFRGGGVSTLDMLDISGAVAGSWSGALVYDGGAAVNIGASGCYSPYGSEGRMYYMNLYTASAVNQIFRFDVQNRVLSPYAATDFIQTGAAAVGNRMAAYCAVDGTDLYDVVLLQSHLSTISQEIIALV